MGRGVAILNPLELLDRYEVKARLIPSLLSCLVLVPGIGGIHASYSVRAFDLLMGGSFTLAWVGMAYAASAAGNRYQKVLWPDWPHDAPTNLWLHPDDKHFSKQQKRIYYKVIRRATGLDISKGAADADRNELRQVINDAVRELRIKFKAEQRTDLLSIHNEDYGFARNLAGLSVFWLPASGLSTALAWTAFGTRGADIGWGLGASIVLIMAIFLRVSLPEFVRQRAQTYADTFFGSLAVMYQEQDSDSLT